MIRRLILIAVLLGLYLLWTPRTLAQTPAPGTLVHVVQAGDTLFSLAQQYGTTVEAIAAINKISSKSILKIGQQLVIPALGDKTVSVATIPVPGYVVTLPDSINTLAWRNGLTIADLAERTHMVNPTLLYAGLNLDFGQAQNGGIANGWVVHVTPQDTLYRLATRYHVSVAALLKANRLTPPVALMPGQVLVIPGSTSDPALVDTPFHRIDIVPLPPQQGRTVLLRFQTPDFATLTGTFMDKSVHVFVGEDGKSQTILFGIDAFAKPGVYPLALTVHGADGSTTQFSRNLLVADGAYNSEMIQLPSDQLDLLDPKVTQPEIDYILNIVSKVTPTRTFDGLMSLPVSAPVTSSFGTRRSYNGGPYDQFHTGTDFGAAPNTPILAPADGVVVMAQALHVRGNALILDHGWGVFTGYWHQTRFNVAVGQHVKRGDIIGYVGGTGRATGPHLHWEMFINGVQVDPLQWTRQNFTP
jgi:murein DD-endopeptidase MepM/ murein hydrolase activator NlpD